ncbi:methyl-CpG-binding domain protein 1a [Megalops cyprinoides]|uniref:methyl-CpG-binding domain protein 1a n=1 Tax=Megalops cyprinoides TaxID=118141 RepID=UPI001863A3EC|nr:methyl-CpG-binding domain protein 1a [Megalops cyprinoides]
MNEGLPDPLIPKSGPGEEGMGGGALKTDGLVSKAMAVGEDASGVVDDAAKRNAGRSVHLDGQVPHGDAECHTQDGSGGAEGAVGGPVKAPGDWLEPLETDTADKDCAQFAVDPLSQGSKVNGSGKPKGKTKPKKSLGRETEKNGGDRIITKTLGNDHLSMVKRKRQQVEKMENWLDWPVLGEGWKRKEVYRRSGFRLGKTDTYYLSPAGGRARSRIELIRLLAGTVDITNFDFKSGRFLDDDSVKGTKKSTFQPPKAENAASTEDGTTSERSVSSWKPGTPERTKTPQNQSVTPQRPSLTPPQASAATPPCSPNSFSSPPRLVRASPLTVITPPRPVSGAPPLPLAEFSPQRLSKTSKAGKASAATPPRSPNSFSSSPRLVRASPLTVITPPHPVTGVPPLPLAEFSSQRLSKTSTPSREPHCPPAILSELSPAWLDSALAPLSPTSSPERDSDVDTTPEGLGAITSSPNLHPPVEKPSLSPAAVSHPLDPSSTPKAKAPPLNYAGGSETIVYGCSNCGCSYPGMVFRRLDQTTLCPKCKPEKKMEGHRSIVFRKWLPCGQCRACQVTEDCGVCASCRHGLFNPASLKPVRCRRRKCLCPIRKVGHGQWVLGRASEEKEAPRTPSKKMNKISKFGRKLKVTKLKRQIAKDLMPYADPQYSDPEDFLPYYDDDDMEWGEPKKRSRRACWKCDACLRTTDCGKCDFCMDKPKFGGRNKKRQKCRLRQCKSHAMRHLLPFQMGRSKSRQRSPRHRYTYGKVNRRPRPSWEDMELTDDEDEEGYIGTLRPGLYHVENKDEEEDQVDIDTDSRAEMSQVNSVLNCDSSNARLASEELYVRTYPFTLQDSFQTDSSNLKIINMPVFPVSLHNAGQLPSPPDTEALYHQAQLSERYGVMPELLSKAGKEDAPLVLGDDVEIVEVDTGEPEERDVTPVITQIFSLADSSPAGGDADQDLMRLLASLRRTVLPAHWVGLMVEGPRLHLLQCSKLSTMADTVVQIEPGFFYQICVQDQPLLLTHPLYEEHPPRLADVEQVAALLLDLEQHSVCQGYPPAAPPANREPVLYVRAAACSLLVPQSQERCDKCDITQLVL